MRMIFVLVLSGLPFLANADVTAPSGKVIDCYCTNSTGARVELGEVICLHVDGRMFLARCEMALNNPFWREVREGCVTSGLGRSLPQSKRDS